MLTLNLVHHLDCFDFLKLIDDASVDLAVIDPPYFLNKAQWDVFSNHNEFLNFTFGWLDAVIPKLKNGGSFYIFNTPYNCALILPHIQDKGLTFQNWITWDKRDGLSYSTKRYAGAQETILFFTKGREHIFNVDDIRLPYESVSRIQHARKLGILKNGKRWFPNPKGKLCTDVWHISSERHQNKVNGKTPKMSHETPKPLEMIERIIKASSKPNDLVLDCFAGIGTTAIAALQLNRRFIGCDSDERYAKYANDRIQEYLNQAKEVVDDHVYSKPN